MDEEKIVAPEQDVAVSCRVRLARNYKDIPFAPMMRPETSKVTIDRASAAISACDQAAAFERMLMRDLSSDERSRLVERRLISQDLLKFVEMSAVILSEGETISIMVNEEDHLRIQGLLPGMQLERAAEMAFQADEWLGKDNEYAFDSQFGYLTSCPTNTGTGMRASVMLHLPMLTASGQLSSVIQAVGKLGFTVRGLYGEGSEARGALYQLSNQASLGRTEEDILKSLNAAANQIINQERAVRDKVIKQDALPLTDRLCRSLGIMQSARLMSGKEMMNRWSDLRLAASIGLIHASFGVIDNLSVELQPASLNVAAGKELSQRERHALRAEKMRERVRALTK